MPVSSPEQPEIEIEVEYEDYDDVLDRVFYKIEIEAGVVPPTQGTQCQCGVALGSSTFNAPDSFDVYAAAVAIRYNDGESPEFDAFEGFEDNANVSSTLSTLPGFLPGATAHGFSVQVDPFNLPALGPEDRFVLGFLIGFDPDDYAQVNGNRIQFAAGSTDPGHGLSIFNGYQPTLSLPRFRLDPCDFNSDGACNISDVNALLGQGPLANNIPRTDATEIYDLDGDDQLDMDDLDEWLERAAAYNGLDMPYHYGDANLDGVVDEADFAMWQDGAFSRSLRWDDGNFTGDRFVDVEDYNILNANKYASSYNASPVPEPSGMLLIVLSVLASLGYRRRT
ncbi:MAG: PEP-CTERM sorting domain-containing protein [Planctomycetales bacterium]|nr:PEP-CTERM sorting domain-containing protein [Planctomycetales bacterium]